MELRKQAEKLQRELEVLLQTITTDYYYGPLLQTITTDYYYRLLLQTITTDYYYGPLLQTKQAEKLQRELEVLL